MDKDAQFVLNLRLSNLHKQETNLFNNIDESIFKDPKKQGKILNLDPSLEPESEVPNRGSTNLY